MEKYEIFILALLVVAILISGYFIFYREKSGFTENTKYPIDVSNQFVQELLEKNNLPTQLFLKKEIGLLEEEEVQISWDVDKLKRKIKEEIPVSIYSWYHEDTSSSGSSNDNAIQSYAQLKYIPRFLQENKKFSMGKNLVLSSRELGTTVYNVSCPFFTVPYGVASEYGNKSDDMSTLRGVVKSGGIYTIPHLSKYTIEQFASEINQISGSGSGSKPFFMYQVYLTGNNEVNISLIERAKASGASVIIFTIDVGSNNHGGLQLVENQGAVTFSFPFCEVLFNDPVFNIELYKERKIVGTENRDILTVVSEKVGETIESLLAVYNLQGAMDYGKYIQSKGMKRANYSLNDPELYNWSVQNIASICHSTISVSKYINRSFSGGVPLVIKGCMSVEDALLAQKGGADGVYISSHGGRFLYNSVSPLHMLPLIRERVKKIDSNFGVWIDGGIRSGVDIFGAYCKGAEFVGLGRPLIYACVLYGEPGVSSFQKKFMFELEAQASLCGQNNLGDYNSLKSCLK